jgi:hypothetical protein
VTSNNHVHLDSMHVTHPLSPRVATRRRAFTPPATTYLLLHLKSSSLLYKIRVELMAPQPPSQVNLVTHPLQMAHFELFSAPRAPLLAPALLPKPALLLCFEIRTPSSHTFCTPSLPRCDSLLRSFHA